MNGIQPFIIGVALGLVIAGFIALTWDFPQIIIRQAG